MSGGEARRPNRPPALRVRFLGQIEYLDALALQESLLQEKVAGEAGDDLLLLEHPAVYTLGRGASESDLLEAPRKLAVPVHRVGRGGGATFHGPGQLVCYPIVRLRPSRDVHRYVRGLEQVLVETCARLGVEAAAEHAGQVEVALPRLGPQVLAVVQGAADRVGVAVDHDGVPVQLQRVDHEVTASGGVSGRGCSCWCG